MGELDHAASSGTEIFVCDGGALYGHPRVYLKREADNAVKCPYCGQVLSDGMLQTKRENE